MSYMPKLLSKDVLFLSSTNKFYITFHPTAGDKIYHVQSDRAYGWWSGLVTEVMIADHRYLACVLSGQSYKYSLACENAALSHFSTNILNQRNRK